MRNLGTVVLVVVLAWACGGGTPFKEGGKAASELKGRVIKGPVSNAAVVAYRASAALERGDVLAQAKADEAGDFVLALPPYQGNVLVVATAGSYIEEAIGLGVQLGDNELQLLLPDFTTGLKLEGLRVTPVSTLAVSLARFHVAAGQSAADAHREALQHLHKHFGDVDWATITPVDLSAPGVTNLSPEARAGLVLAGLSWLAKQEAEASDLTPGLVVNAATLTSALARDAADGTLDGRAGTEQLKQGKVSLTGLTLRAELVQAMSAFLNSPRNASALRLQDTTTFLAAIGTNSDAYLFCPGQVPAVTCGSGPVDTEPPVLAFVKPNPGAGVAGSAQVKVHASDNVKLKTLKFTAPPSLEATVPVFTSEGREGVLTAVLDVSALMDGPLELRAEVTDESGNPAAKSITITVSNLGPRITIATPVDASPVRGTSVPVVASATAQAPGATISRIELITPPPGMGPDVLPAADSFSATWNTSTALEGSTTLTVRATDSFGTSTEAAVTVTVDNLPFGKVSAVVSAGAPVDGLTVKVVAIDDATGLPVTGRLGGPILGQSSDLTADGGVSFDLSQENYNGPVQVVAEGSGASYVDPSDGVTDILLPATFSFSSYVASYQSGDRLDVPVTFWTTLADEAARAYALGRNPAQATPILLVPALRAVDPLFARHITSQAWAVRSAYPARLTTTPQSLRDVVYAALPDVALNQEARDLAEEVGLTPGTGFGAPQLVAMLRQDIADGQFDGRTNGVQLRTGGITPYELDANTTRFRQAIGADRFIRGAENRTGLSRQDLQTQSIYDTMSGDTSLLYSSLVAPVPFDNVPPVVAWTVTFSNGALATASPVGGSRLVAGVLQVQATATDVSNVASIAVTAGSTQLVPAAGSTVSRLVSTFDTSALVDGPLTLTSTSCDRLANCGTSTYVVTVDRTGPSLTVLKPTPAFVSAAFDIEATATDAQGLASLDVSAPAGLVDQDAQVGRAFVPGASWTLTASDGPLSVGFGGCDVVGNCATASAGVTVDKTPPTLSWVAQPPQYSRLNLVSFSVSATDGAGAGVQRVFAGVDYLNAVEGVRSGGTWSFTNFDLGAEGRKNLRVWAEDSALPANTGRMSGSSAADLGVTVLRDNTAPTLVGASYKTFKDEDSVTLGTGSNGQPLVPAQYNFGAASSRVIDLGAGTITIKKADTLTSAAANRPTLTWQVPYNSSSEAPLSSVTWSATRTSCRPDFGTCSTVGAGSGLLSVDGAVPSPIAGNVYYSQELTMAAKGTYAFTYTATDAAGNSASRAFTVVWDVVGPPLVVIPDLAWESSGDPQSALPLRIADGSFGRLFGIGAGGFVNNQARLRKYLIYNAAAQEVAVAFRGSNTRSTNEGWTNILGNLYGAEGAGWYAVDGHTFDRNYMSSWTSSSDFCSATGTLMEPYPCARTASSFPYIRHVRGQIAKWECFGNVYSEGPTNYGPALINGTATAANGATDSTVATQLVSPAATPGSGNETSLASPVFFGTASSAVSGGRVPAATSTAPGVMAVYVVVPIQAHQPALAGGALPHLAGGTGKYQYYFADMVDVSGANAPVPPGGCGVTAQATFYWYRRLATAVTTVSAGFNVESGGGFFLGGITGTLYYSNVTARQVTTTSASISIIH